MEGDRVVLLDGDLGWDGVLLGGFTCFIFVDSLCLVGGGGGYGMRASRIISVFAWDFFYPYTDSGIQFIIIIRMNLAGPPITISLLF